MNALRSRFGQCATFGNSRCATTRKYPVLVGPPGPFAVQAEHRCHVVVLLMSGIYDFTSRMPLDLNKPFQSRVLGVKNIGQMTVMTDSYKLFFLPYRIEDINLGRGM